MHPDLTSAGALAERFRKQATALGPDVFIGHDDESFSGSAVRDLLDEKTETYGKAGIGPGDFVGAYSWPPADFVTDFYAVLGLGGTVVPLPRTLSGWELERLDTVGHLTCLTSPSDSLLTLGDDSFTTSSRRLSRCARHRPTAPTGAATGQLTSGTTRSQKLALRPASALAAEASGYHRALALTPEELVLCPVPLHHAYGFGVGVVSAALYGVPVRYSAKLQPRQLLRSMEQGRPVLLASVSPMLRLLAESMGEQSSPPHAVRLLYGGMPLDRRTAEKVSSVLGAPIGQIYGTTESGPVCVTTPGDWNTTVRALGPPLPGVSLSLDDAGFIVVRSPMMMLGYARDGALDEDSVPHDGFVTGDLGRRTEDGLTIVGRAATSINVAGAKVSPEEVEAVLLEHPDVGSCLVHGVEDGRLGQRVAAVVTPETVDLRKLEQFCRERLSPPWLPQVFSAVATLETTSTGKVVRRLVEH
ncbi:class I adenylate-forming enzyme family protein [Actinoplanes derwentensis]|uniref:AMP-binding enzyme C-terminal domain-containing protein n=1 Tax=Actinoplanes derwentensis TaxID=113562 RepID=A0A1H2DE66_9ACTN|nr:class I adenylate-forming enzyme family protein [Actinoplanes derwentensis]GID90094.1 AMP-dependent synthetase [Actinoplanes derwentensis]SDT80782.1 AMP-binding enzyme C-terminal domain-containing protein [Actinoplanes derwentensis]